MVDCNGRGIKVNGNYLWHLAYADDIAILAHTTQDAMELCDQLQTYTEAIGLQINKEKTKFMIQSRSQVDQDTITLHGDSIERVYSFCYLGQKLKWPRNHNVELSSRISAVWGSFRRYKTFITSRRVPLAMKKKLIDLCIAPVILYGCESWAFTKATSTRLLRAQRRLERRMVGVRLLDKVPTVTLRNRTKLKDWGKEARRRKWNWLWKMISNGGEKWSAILTTWSLKDDYPTAKRPQGRPRIRWIDDIKKIVSNWTSMNRLQWDNYLSHYICTD